MTTSKIFFRNFLGLMLIVCTVLSVLCLLLDSLGLYAYLTHEKAIASGFFHESLYLLAFFIPPYFIGKYINRAELVKAMEEYILLKSKEERV